VTNILRNLENVNSSKIYQFSPAIDLNRYANKDPNLREKMLQKYDLKESDIVIGVCSRFDYYKGLKYVIEGFSLAAKKHKNIKLIFFGASGIEFDSLSRLAKNKLPNNTYQFVKYEKNILGAYAIMDIFIHVPIAYDEEAFGLVYVEAMASSIACVFTISGISAKLLKHNNNALVVGYKSSSDINTALQRLIKNKGLRNKIGIQAKKDVIKYFPENEVYENLANLYKKLTNKSSN